jgi:hypothetical protein
MVDRCWWISLGYVLQVDELPAEDVQTKERLLSSLKAEPPSKDLWQVGGNTNFMIAAARLGLNVSCCGHVGDDVFGHYLLDCLRVCPPSLSADPTINLNPWSAGGDHGNLAGIYLSISSVSVLCDMFALITIRKPRFTRGSLERAPSRPHECSLSLE